LAGQAWLQSHKGGSGTLGRDVIGQFVTGLQSHKGGSGTVGGGPSPSAFADASISQGWFWNRHRKPFVRWQTGLQSHKGGSGTAENVTLTPH